MVIANNSTHGSFAESVQRVRSNDTKSDGSNVAPVGFSSNSFASEQLGGLKDALSLSSRARSMQVAMETSQGAKDVVRDMEEADVATKNAVTTIQRSSSMAVLAQANGIPQKVMALLN